MTIQQSYNELPPITVHPPIINNICENMLFYSDYIENYSIYDVEFLRLFGNLSTDLDYFFKLQHFASTTVLMHKNELDRLWNYTQLEYNPISNYDKKSEITYLNDKVTTQNVYGEQKHLLDKVTTQNVHGEQKHLLDKVTVNNTVGTSTITNVNEKTKTVVDEKQYGYNNSDGKNKSETTTTISNGAGSDITNTTTDTGRTDSSISSGTATNGKIENVDNSYTDSVTTKGTGTNDKIENVDNSHTDTVTTSGTSIDGKIENKIIEKTSGNIGVQTATEMLEKEWSFWFNHNFYDYLFEIIKYGLTDNGFYEFDEE